MREVVIRAGDVTVRARVLNTPTAERIWAALPIVAAARTWGAEVYFDTDVTSAAEPDARETVKAGEIAFWPEGEAITIGFGPTPLSRTKAEIRFASPCNIWAQALDDVRQFKAVHAGEPISVSQVPR
ncbi:MAG: cyclophilin-like fold protein [Hyphomicrobium sp.]